MASVAGEVRLGVCANVPVQPGVVIVTCQAHAIDVVTGNVFREHDIRVVSGPVSMLSARAMAICANGV
jgi:hypothetical protein